MSAGDSVGLSYGEIATKVGQTEERVIASERI